MLFYSAWSRYGGVSGSMMGWSCAMKIRRRTHLVRDLMLATHGTMKTKTRTTHVVRAAIVCAGAALWQWPQRSDRVVERVWEWARGSAVFSEIFHPMGMPPDLARTSAATCAQVSVTTHVQESVGRGTDSAEVGGGLDVDKRRRRDGIRTKLNAAHRRNARRDLVGR